MKTPRVRRATAFLGVASIAISGMYAVAPAALAAETGENALAATSNHAEAATIELPASQGTGAGATQAGESGSASSAGSDVSPSANASGSVAGAETSSAHETVRNAVAPTAEGTSADATRAAAGTPTTSAAGTSTEGTATEPAATESAPSTSSASNNAFIVELAKLDWVIHQGWYDYMSNKKGGTDGVIDAGRGARHIPYRKSLTWGTGVGNCTSEGTCDIAFPGVVTFKKHKQGEVYALDMRIEDLRIHTEGTQGSVIVKIRSKDMSAGEYVENPSWTMMTFTLPQAVSVGESDSLSIQITDPVFASDASRYFTMYNNELGASAKLSATTHPDGRPDAKGIIWERVGEDHRIDFNIVQWPIIKDFFAKSKADGVRMSTSGGIKPLGESLDFSKPEARIDADTLILTYPGEIRLFKEKEGGDTETLSEIRDLQLRISANDHGEIYMTVKRWVDGQAREQLTHIGTFFGKIYYYAGELTLHVRDAAVRIDPDSTLVIPYLTNSENVAPLSFRFDVTDQNLDNREARLAVVNAFRDRQLTWLNRSPIFSTTYGEYTPVQPSQPISVEEENAAWQDAPAPRANIGELLWGVKRSWQGYVGKGTLDGGAEYSFDTRNYTFPAATPAVTRSENGEVIAQFMGSAHWEAYGGILNITMADLQVHLTPKDPKNLTKGFENDMPVYARIGSGAALNRYTRLGTIRGEASARVENGVDVSGADVTPGGARNVVSGLGLRALAMPAAAAAGAAGAGSAAAGSAAAGAAESVVISVDNQPFYLHKDVADVFVNVYRGGLRMDNISFAARTTVEKPNTDQPVEPTPGDQADPSANSGDQTDPNIDPAQPGDPNTADPNAESSGMDNAGVVNAGTQQPNAGQEPTTGHSTGKQNVSKQADGKGTGDKHASGKHAAEKHSAGKHGALPATGVAGELLAGACMALLLGAVALRARRVRG